MSQQVCGKNEQCVSLKLTAAWPADGAVVSAVVRSMMTSCQPEPSEAKLPMQLTGLLLKPSPCRPTYCACVSTCKCATCQRRCQFVNAINIRLKNCLLSTGNKLKKKGSGLTRALSYTHTLSFSRTRCC